MHTVFSKHYHLARGYTQKKESVEGKETLLESDEAFVQRCGGWLRTVVVTSPPWGVFKEDTHDKRLTKDEIKVVAVVCTCMPIAFRACMPIELHAYLPPMNALVLPVCVRPSALACA